MNRIFKVAFLIMLTINTLRVSSQEFNPFIDSLKSLCSYDTVTSNLYEFEGLGIKEPGTEEIDNAANWVIEKHLSFGYEDIRRDTFVYYGDTLFNIVVTKQGTEYPNTYLIVDGHYDTENGPGSNDNGSGVVSVMEAARIMQNIETKYSVKFIYFSAEESGLIGSHHYVDNVVVPENMDIRLVFNIDEVGGVNGMSNTTITCERDEGSPVVNNAESAAFTDTLANCVTLYSDLTPNISYAYGSDYMPFEDNEEIITGLYEYNESPYPHSINDSISNLDLDYVFEVAKITTAASLYFAQAYEEEDTTGIPEFFVETEFNVFPNPGDEYFIITSSANQKQNIPLIQIFNTQGQLVLERNDISASDERININQLPSGLYIVKVFNGIGFEKLKFIKEASM